MGQAGVYTRLSAYNDWIEGVMKNAATPFQPQTSGGHVLTHARNILIICLVPVLISKLVH